MRLKEGEYKVRKVKFGKSRHDQRKNTFYIKYRTKKEYNKQLDTIKGRYETRLKGMKVVELKPKKKKYTEFINKEKFAEFVEGA